MRPHLNQDLGAVAYICHPKICEVEIGRITVTVQSRQKILRDPHLNRKKKKKLGMVTHTCHKIGGSRVQAGLD
jgi:hypothetical protein